MTTLSYRKAKAVFDIYFQEGLAYRASGVIWVITDVTTAITMPLVWVAASKSGAVGGFTSSDFVLYYLSLLLLTGFVTSHMMWDIAVEIKEGQFTNSLLRPIGFFPLIFIRNLAWRLIRPTLFLPFFFLLLLAYRPYLTDAHVHLGFEFWASLIGGHLVSFTMGTALSMLALFTTEAMAIFEIYYIPLLLFSGQFFPLAVLPPWLSNISRILPFYYTVGAPTEILVGRVAGSAIYSILAIQLGWIVGFYILFRILWKVGLKRYTGVGM
jgi:ABC-2 type transport system permease protein